MAEESIDRISVEISSDAGAAVRNLNNLVTALGNLEGKVGSSAAKLLQLSSALNSLKRSAAGFDAAGLKQLGEVKFSATVPKNLNTLVNTLNSMPADSAAKLMGISNGLRGLGNVSLGKGVVDQIAKIPAIVREFSNFNMGAFSTQLRELNAQLAPLAANIDRLATAYAKLPKSMQTAGLAARSVASSNKYLQASNAALVASNNAVAASHNRVLASLKSLGSGIMATIGKVSKLSAAWYGFKRVFEATIGNVNSYIENMNLFEASMGSYTESALEYAQKLQDVLGIDMGEWARNQGVFMTLATGMGVTADKAAVMSQQLTQLGYDISSFYNMNVDESMLKLQSGIAGELEPLRRIGWDLSNARMQAEMTSLSIGDLEVDLSDAAMESAALSLGLNKNVSSMTQAEKVAIRYHLIMTQVTQVHGDMARTIDSPANQLRVLQAQVQLTARAIGNLLIPALNAILPVAMAVVKAVRLVAQAIASLFGVDAKFEVDYSTLDTSGIAAGGVDDLTDALEDSGTAADKAKKKVKEYQNTVMGFDELNKLNATPEDTSGGSGGSGAGAGGGGGFDLPLETYDFLEGLKSDIAQRTDEMAQAILGLLPYIGAVAAGLAAWKIASAFGADLRTCAGLAMAVAGGVMMVYNWLDMWQNGVNWGNLLGYLGGMALLVGGLALAFGPVAAAIGGIVGLAALGAAALHDMFTNGHSWANELAAAISGLGLEGLGLALEKVAGKFGDAIGPFKQPFLEAVKHAAPVLRVLGKIAGAIGMVISVIDLVYNGLAVFDAIQSGGEVSTDVIFGLVTSILGIGLGLSAVLGWPVLVVAAVVAAVTAIALAVYNNWDEICAFVAGIPEWFDVNVVQPVCGFFAGIGDFLGGLWSDVVAGISQWWSGVAQWFDDNVVQPIMAFWEPIVQWFSDLWGSISATAEAMWHNIGVFADGCWQIVVRVWEVVSEWFDKNVIQPVSQFFSGLWSAVSTAAQNAWNAISGVWTVVSNWFNEHVIQPISGFFSGLWNGIKTAAQGAWNAVKDVFSGVANWFSGIFSSAWQAVLKVFQYGGQIFNGVVDAILGAVKWAVNGLISGMNWAIAQPFNGLNSIIGAMRNWEILGIRPFSGFWDIPVPQIPYLAEGRYGIDSGQLFVAREKGAEMVGSMNGHTTVANNQQIVEGIEAGVMSAMVKVLAMQDSSGGETHIEIPLIIGHEEIARATWRGEASLIRRGELKPQFA